MIVLTCYIFFLFSRLFIFKIQCLGDMACRGTRIRPCVVCEPLFFCVFFFLHDSKRLTFVCLLWFWYFKLGFSFHKPITKCLPSVLVTALITHHWFCFSISRTRRRMDLFPFAPSTVGVVIRWAWTASAAWAGLCAVLELSPSFTKAADVSRLRHPPFPCRLYWGSPAVPADWWGRWG